MLLFPWRRNFDLDVCASATAVPGNVRIQEISQSLCRALWNNSSPWSVNYIIVWPAFKWRSFLLLSFVVMPGRGKKIIHQSCMNNCGRQGNHWLKKGWAGHSGGAEGELPWRRWNHSATNAAELFPSAALLPSLRSFYCQESWERTFSSWALHCSGNENMERRQGKKKCAF